MTETTGSASPRRAARSEKESAATPAESHPAFQPQQYLENRDGLPYLPLKWRLTWLRAEHPQAKVNTKLVTLNDGVAVFRAEIELPNGASATGWGARSANDDSSGDQGPLGYVTAAENQALSRALAALGFGTEYAYDFDPPADTPAIILPETPDYQGEEDEGIELPITINISRSTPTNGSYALPATLLTDDEDDEDEDNEDEDDEDFTPKGEIRNLSRPTPATPPPAPMRERPTPATPPAPTPARERPTPPAAAPVSVPAPGTGSQIVEERLKNVRDEALRVKIKQIYYEARQRFNYDEEKVDSRSRDIYKKPTYELDAEEAENYYERILTAAKRRPQN